MKRGVWFFVGLVVLWAVSAPLWAASIGYKLTPQYWNYTVWSAWWDGAQVCTSNGYGFVAQGATTPNGLTCNGAYGCCTSGQSHGVVRQMTYSCTDPRNIVCGEGGTGCYCTGTDGLCPTGYTLSGDICLPSCTPPQTWSGSACVDPPCPTGSSSGSVRFQGTSLPATLCLGGCAYTPGGVSVGIPENGVMTWATGGTSTGATCTTDNVTAGEPLGDVDGCVTDSHGRVVCPSTTPDCITVNGNEVCDVNGQQCEVVNGKISCAGGEPLDPDTVACWDEGGQTVCAGSSGGTSSTTSTTVNPDGTTTRTTTTTSNLQGTGTRTTVTIYDSGGNIISSSTTLTGGSDPGSSGSGTGQDGEVGGTGDGEGTEDTEKETFSGGQLGTGAALDLSGKDKAAAQSKIDTGWASVKAAPIVAALSVNAGSVPVSACPTLSMTLPLGIGAVSTDLHCTTWEAVKGVLSVVSLAAWAILGIIIIASA